MIVCEDETASVLVVNVAVTVLDPLRLAVPSDVVPSLKVTVPPLSNVPENCGLTVAVNVTV